MPIKDKPAKTLELGDRWAQLIEIHNHAKAIFLLAEEFDPKSKDFIQPPMELRHALEHIIRAQAVLLGISNGGDTPTGELEYVQHSFDKAIGHEYRAFFDAADWLSVSIRTRIVETLNPYSHECIEVVIPDYYPTLRPRVDQSCHKIAAIRGAKDVARNLDIKARVGKSKETIAEVGGYQKIIAELLDIDEKIHDSIPAMIDWKKKNYRSAFWKWFLRVVGGGIIVAVVSAYILDWMGFFKS